MRIQALANLACIAVGHRGVPDCRKMKSCQQVARFIQGQPHIVRLLGAVEALGIPDCWIGAGLIRNAVWDHLHGLAPGTIAGSDADVIYWDPRDASLARDVAIEARLAAAVPGAPWSVHNQARMHDRNADAPYTGVADAIRCWPETATAIAARLQGDRVEVLAPLGVEDLVGLVVRPTLAFARNPQKMDAYRARMAGKDWALRWPKLRFIGA